VRLSGLTLHRPNLQYAFQLGTLEKGHFDPIEAANEIFEANFFRFPGAKLVLNKLAESYPHAP
jgi:hypothetical protein